MSQERFCAFFSLFLRHGGVIRSRVTGSRQYSRDLPQGGLKLPCLYLFEGKASVIEKVRSRVLSLTSPVTHLETAAAGVIPVEGESVLVVNLSQADEPKSSGSQNTALEWTRAHDIVLTIEDRQMISSGQRLTDRHINFAQRLIQAQFQQLDGLHLTLIQDKQYSGSKKNFLQVLFIKEGHWVVIASHDGKVFQIYDSL